MYSYFQWRKKIAIIAKMYKKKQRKRANEVVCEQEKKQMIFVGCTYSPCKQMVSCPNVISCAHSNCWPNSTFCHTLYTPVAYSLLYGWRCLFAALSTFEDQYSILVLLHPMPKTLEYPAVATVCVVSKTTVKQAKKKPEI